MRKSQQDIEIDKDWDTLAEICDATEAIVTSQYKFRTESGEEAFRRFQARQQNSLDILNRDIDNLHEAEMEVA